MVDQVVGTGGQLVQQLLLRLLLHLLLRRLSHPDSTGGRLQRQGWRQLLQPAARAVQLTQRKPRVLAPCSWIGAAVQPWPRDCLPPCRRYNTVGWDGSPRFP